MSKYDYITKNEQLAHNLSTELEQIITKYGLTIDRIVEDNFEGHIVAHFKLMGESENESSH